MDGFHEWFYQVMANLRCSRAPCSTTQEPRDDARVTEIINVVIVSKPAKKITYIDGTKGKESESEPEIIELGSKSKAASVQGINKIKEIHDFINMGY
jgi:hypothetical protein